MAKTIAKGKAMRTPEIAWLWLNVSYTRSKTVVF